MTRHEHRDEAVFVLRRAPTVERTWGVRDGLIFNCLVLNAPLMIMLQLMVALPGYPEGSVVSAVLIAGLCCLGLTVVYAYLGSSYPRNGGDYLFQRRLLSTRWGALFGFTGIVVGGALAAAFAGWMAARMVAAPALVLLGTALGRPGIIDTAWSLQSTSAALVAALALLCLALAFNLSGMRRYASVQLWMFLAAGIAMLCCVVALWLLPPSLNAHAFSMLGGPGRGVPYPPADASPVTATVLLVPFMAIALLPVTWSVALGGEIRGGGSLRRQMIMLVGAEVSVVALTAAFTALVTARYGRQELATAGALFLRVPSDLPLPCPPLYWVAPGWSLLAPVALLVSSGLALVMWVSSLALAGSRVVQVVSAERLLPRWLAAGAGRQAVPRRSLIAFLLLAAAIALALCWTDKWLLAVDAVQMVLFSSIVTAAAGVVYPFLRREDYRESTAARSELLGVPVITLAGLLFVGFAGFAGWGLLFDDRLLLGAHPVAGRALLVGAYVCTLATFGLHRLVRRLRPEGQIELLCEPVPMQGKRE